MAGGTREPRTKAASKVNVSLRMTAPPSQNHGNVSVRDTVRCEGDAILWRRAPAARLVPSAELRAFVETISGIMSQRSRLPFSQQRAAHRPLEEYARGVGELQVDSTPDQLVAFRIMRERLTPTGPSTDLFLRFSETLLAGVADVPRTAQFERGASTRGS